MRRYVLNFITEIFEQYVNSAYIIIQIHLVFLVLKLAQENFLARDPYQGFRPRSYSVEHQRFLWKFWLKVCPAQRHVGKTNFSIWRHSDEQVYLGYNHNKCLQSVRTTCLSSMEEGRRTGIFCSHLSPTSVHNLRKLLRKSSYFYDCLSCRKGGRSSSRDSKELASYSDVASFSDSEGPFQVKRGPLANLLSFH